MKKCYRSVVAMLMSIFSVALLVGCGSSSNQPASTSPAASTGKAASSSAGSATTQASAKSTDTSKPYKGVTLTIIGTSDSIKEVERTTIADAFEAETGIKMDYQLIEDSQYYDLLYTKLNSGTAPDLFEGQSGSFNIKSEYNPEKNCVDLSNEKWVDRYDDLVKSQSSVDGKVYCQTLWNTNSVWAMIYNKTLFKQLGISVPTTYADFEAACKKIKDAGITPVYESASDGWHANCSFTEMFVKVEADNPGTYDKLNNNTLKIADIPEALTLVKQFKNIGQNYSGDSYLSNEFSNSMGSLADGSYAMTVNRVDAITQVDKDYPDAKYDSADFGAFVVPYLDNQIRNVNPNGNSKFIFSGSKNIDAAKLYLEFLARPENLQAMIKAEPAYSWLPFKGITPNYSAAEKEFYDKYTTAKTVPQSAVMYIDPQWADTSNDIVALYTNQITDEQFLKNIDARRETQAKEAGNPNW